jgi:hypothetical protein
MKRKTTEQFIEGAKVIHGDRYDYSLVEYVGTHVKVKIVCNEHGEFEQAPKGHLRGEGCPSCVGRNKTSEQFIKEVREVHGNLYDYSLVEYKSSSQKVTIICKDHGEFSQLPGDHRYGYGCPGCFIKRAKTNEDFIKEAREVHGDRYDYSLIKYKSAHHKIEIMCSDHGVFNQRPTDHLRANGCPDCARRGYIPSKGGWLYYIKFETDDCEFYKIGITNGDIETRIKHFYLKEDVVLEIIFSQWFEDGYVPQQIERQILQSNKEYKFDTKQYMKNGFSETFSIDVLDGNYKF